MAGPVPRFDAHAAAEGSPLPPWTLEDVSRTLFVRYAGASGDFNPIHHDERFARDAGYPTVFGPGMLTAGLLGRYLVRLFGEGTLRRFRVRFAAQVWPGDRLRFEGVLVRSSGEGAERAIECTLSVSNQDGVVVLSGSATAVVGST